MSSNCLLTAATISVLLCALLTAAFDLVELRTRPRRGHIASHRSKPEQKADALLKEWNPDAVSPGNFARGDAAARLS